MAVEHKDLLRRWLRGHGHHASDIAVALAWYDAQRSNGREPEDKEVMAQADASHATAVERYSDPSQTPAAFIVHQHEYMLSWRLLLSSAAGGFLFEALKWLASAQMRSQ